MTDSEAVEIASKAFELGRSSAADEMLSGVKRAVAPTALEDLNEKARTAWEKYQSEQRQIAKSTKIDTSGNDDRPGAREQLADDRKRQAEFLAMTPEQKAQFIRERAKRGREKLTEHMLKH